MNLPGPQMWNAVEALAPLTGASDVPAPKRSYSRYEPAKFEAAGLTPLPSARVQPPRVDGCDLQLEATVRSTRRGGPDGTFVIVEAEVIFIHASEEVVVAGTNHIDPTRWRPLIYSFRRYFGLGGELGHSFRAER